MEIKVSQLGCFQITGRWICYSIFFDISFVVFFARLLSKSLWRNYPFSAQTSKIYFKIYYIQKIRMSNFVMLKWRPCEYKVKNWKICPFLGLFCSEMISHKMTYMGLLLLKLRAVELESRTESRLLISNWYIFYILGKLSKTWFWTVTSRK